MDPIEIINEFYPPGKLRDLLLIHSEKVRDKAVEAFRASGLSGDEELIRKGAMLHDIGIFKCYAPSIECRGSKPYIQHGIIGAEILREKGLPELARFCERHTGSGLTGEDIIEQNLPLPHKNFLPETIEEKAVCYADKFFSKSGDPTREKDPERVIQSMKKHGEKTLQRFLELHYLFSQQ